MRLWEYERLAQRRLAKAGVDCPGLCARMLTAHACGIDDLIYTLSRNEQLSKQEADIFFSTLERRAHGEPMAYILGKKEFYSREFIISPEVLIPRPETELLVETALKLFAKQRIFFLDTGCGSGCIGISLLAENPNWQGILLDNNRAALLVAQKNALALAPYANLLLGNIFCLPFNSCTFDLIISNPPYIAPQSKDIMPEVLAWEPHSALFSAEDGLAHLITVIKQAGQILKPGGWLILEHGWDQGEYLCQLLQNSYWTDIEDLTDLAGLPRCVVAQKI